MKFIKFFRKKSDIDKESVFKLLNNKTRISYNNIYGDGEACDIDTYKNEKRSTGKIEDITRIYFYENNELKYIIRVDSEKIVYCNPLTNRSKDDVVSIDKTFINEILDRIKSII